jgi:hypothetical protein
MTEEVDNNDAPEEGDSKPPLYLTDADVVSSNKEVGEPVFYAICSSLQGSDAHSLATALYDAKILNPFRLWSDIVAYYDTDINWANIVLFDVKHLLNL